MSKKYKLIKEYPGGPKIPITVFKNGNYYQSNFIIDNVQHFHQPLSIVENNSEYWQEITKPEYTILSFYRKSDNMVFFMSIGESYGVKYKRKDSAFLYSLEEFTTKSKGNWTEEFEIYQVRRESDDEVFTIGDTYITKVNRKVRTIKLIFLNEGSICIHDSPEIFEEFDCELHHLIKSKQPLFTTEDGVDIYDDSLTPYCVDTFWTIINFFPKRTMKGFTINPNSGDKYFSSKEKAEEFIMMNKPCLSLKDVASIYPGINKIHKSSSHQAEKLKELVKQKLK